MQQVVPEADEEPADGSRSLSQTRMQNWAQICHRLKVPPIWCHGQD